MHNDEALFQLAGYMRERHAGKARTTMHQQQHRTVAVPSADQNPLIHPA
jgi:hypothetical protein